MSTDKVETVYAGKFLVFKTKGTWEFVERPHGTGVVAVLAITDQDEIVLIEQVRMAIGKPIIELPAGLAGDTDLKDEALAAAALRELREETGYEAEQIDYLTDGPSSAGLTTETITFFRARGLRKTGAGGGDHTESITVHLVPRAELHNWVTDKRKEGCLIDYKIYTALYFENQR